MKQARNIHVGISGALWKGYQQHDSPDRGWCAASPAILFLGFFAGCPRRSATAWHSACDLRPTGRRGSPRPCRVREWPRAGASATSPLLLQPPNRRPVALAPHGHRRRHRRQVGRGRRRQLRRKALGRHRRRPWRSLLTDASIGSTRSVRARQCIRLKTSSRR